MIPSASRLFLKTCAKDKLRIITITQYVGIFFPLLVFLKDFFTPLLMEKYSQSLNIYLIIVLIVKILLENEL